MIAQWVSQYIGLPFRPRGRDRQGIDCWGLIRLIYGERYGISLPEHPGIGCNDLDHAGISGIIEQDHEEWSPIPQAEAVEGDAIVIRIGAAPVHVALYIGGGLMLHINNGAESCIEPLSAPMWAKRIEGFYRHVSLA